MRWTGQEPVISAAFNDAANKKPKKPQIHKSRRKGTRRSDVSPVTLRLTEDERVRLEEMAVGMTLSAYIRACVFSEEDKRRKRRPKDAVADKKALAECLALLGHSRMASNLNQLAYQANVGALIADDEVKGQITESYEAIKEMRALLIAALKE
ncbi:plasmid mobilization protein [Tateyamaria sp.]|uniref:plasmid mobilization protein n=1 Tax=Tateyamaria sp. TaxID=1929288 RepID=UPI00329B24B4